MNSQRVYYLLCSLIVLFLVATAGGAYEINSVLGKQSDTLVNAKAQVASLQQEQLELTKAKKDISSYTELYNISRVVVPQNKDQAEAVRQIVKLASQSGVSLSSITFPPSTLGGGGTSGIANAPASATSSAASSSLGASAAGSAAASLSQLKKVANIPGVYQLELTVSGSSPVGKLVAYPQLINFLAALEHNRLTALVSALTITPPSTNSGTSGTTTATTDSFSFQLTLDIYIKPQG